MVEGVFLGVTLGERATPVNASAPRGKDAIVHGLWKTLWTACGQQALCCGSHRIGDNQHMPDPYSAGPVAALRRIAFLLERSRAETYKVKAFRAAAATILPLGEEVATRVQDGTLRDLPGIGASTAEVIEDAVAGRTPARLARLEEETGGALVEGGADIRVALRGDLHSHSDWSDGGSPIEEMAFTAMELGHEYLVLTDHSPRLKVANGLSVARLTEQLSVVDAVNEHVGSSGTRPFRLLKGIEVDILDDGSLDQTEEMLARLDVRVASVHSKLRMDKDAMTRRMRAAVANPFTNVLGHCTGRLVTGGRGIRPQSEFDARAVFEACAEHDVAVEINSRPERRDPPTKLLQLAIELGCVFSIDSDAHAPGQLDFLSYGCARAEEMGLDPDRIVNTWPAERLLTWAGAAISD
jgi:putative hydrolase